MNFDNERLLTGGEPPNKEETEIPIGEPREPDLRTYVMWRCRDCGEMGRLEDGLPAECPECVASRESLYYWEED